MAGGTYPSNVTNPEQDDAYSTYKVYESFWVEDGVMKYGVHNDFDVWLVDPVDSPYGDEIPLIMGLCLTEPHELIGEPLTMPLEAPQESYNYFLNMRLGCSTVTPDVLVLGLYPTYSISFLVRL